MSSSELQNVDKIFSIFYDGFISGSQGDLNKLTLKVECRYLAALFKPHFEYFFIELTEVSQLDFDPWMVPHDKEPIKHPILEKYFYEYLEILSPKIVGDTVQISFNQHEKDLGYCGGLLTLAAQEARVYNQELKLISLRHLEAVCGYYWDNLGWIQESDIYKLQC